MTRNGKLIITLWFVAFMIFPIAAGLAGVSARTVENQVPAPLPEFTAAGILDAATYRQVAEYLKDRLPLRGEAIEADAHLDRDIYRDNPNPQQVHIGEDGWLFFAGTWTKPCSSQVSGDEVVERLGRIERIITATGREARIIVAPDKMTIYPEKFGPAIEDLPDCTTVNRGQLQDGLMGGAVASNVDLWGVLPPHRPDKLYYRGDTHWTPYGASYLVQELVESLEPGLWEPQALVRSPGGGRVAGTATVLGLPEFEEADRVSVQREGVAIESVTEWRRHVGEDLERVPADEMLIAVTADGSNIEFTIPHVGRAFNQRRVVMSGGADQVDRPTTIIHDSFLWDPMELVPQYFSDVRFDHWASMGRDYVAEDLRDADLVVIQSVERIVYERMEDEAPALAAFLDAYRDELPSVEIPVDEALAAAGSDLRYVGEPEAGVMATTSRANLRLPATEPLAPAGDRYLLVEALAPEPTRVVLQWAPRGQPVNPDDNLVLGVAAGASRFAFDLSSIPDDARLRLRPRLEGLVVTGLHLIDVPAGA